ncbi:Uncharacterised protein [Burkholderia pseudomallei]|nr:Uncharacterised protein [Burkholderia pseudomallei]CAJ6700175.1 Uncharacterised protein [Burkholderia pseudomallei]
MAMEHIVLRFGTKDGDGMSVDHPLGITIPVNGDSVRLEVRGKEVNAQVVSPPMFEYAPVDGGRSRLVAVNYTITAEWPREDRGAD